MQSLKSESAVKIFEILKIFTEFALNETIEETYELTDIKVLFTRTLATELYKAWIKIQGLSGKTLYTGTLDTSS